MASAALTILFALYMPLGAIVCGPFVRNAPDVTHGDAFFGKPKTTLLAINRDGTYIVGTVVVPLTQLREQLRRARAAEPTVPLELHADGTLPTSKIVQALAAAQEAGYTQAYVFGHQHSIIEIASTRPQ